MSWAFQQRNAKVELGFRLVKRPLNVHTYIIGHYNPSVRIIDLVSTEHMFVL